jgi:hypothetical protein
VSKATGSRDADALYAAKETLLAQVKPLKSSASAHTSRVVCPRLLIVFAFIGVPLLFFGWSVRRCSVKN